MTVEKEVYENSFTEVTVRAPIIPFAQNYALQTELIEKATVYHRELDQGLRSSPTYTCDNYNPWGSDTTGLSFLPAFGGVVNEATPSVTFEGDCFENITMTYEKTSDTTFDITLDRRNPKTHMCADSILFANTEI